MFPFLRKKLEAVLSCLQRACHSCMSQCKDCNFKGNDPIFNLTLGIFSSSHVLYVKKNSVFLEMSTRSKFAFQLKKTSLSACSQRKNKPVNRYNLHIRRTKLSSSKVHTLPKSFPLRSYGSNAKRNLARKQFQNSH